MSHSKMPPVPPANRAPQENPHQAHAPQEETPQGARGSGPAEQDNIRQNVTNQGHQQNR